MADEVLLSLRTTYEKLKKACSSELIYFTGPQGLGKTSLVKRLFKEKSKEYLHAYIDCYSIRNQAQLLSKICQAFHNTLNIRRSRSGITAQRLPEPGSPVPLNDFHAAILEYKNIAYSKGYERIFVVLDQVEIFEKTPMMDAVAALCRYNAEDINLVVISCERPMDMIHYIEHKSHTIVPSVQDRCQVVVCKEWLVDDIINWILQTPPKREKEIYQKFVRNVATLMTTTQSRNPVQIRNFCQDHFGDFLLYYKQRRREKVLKQFGLDLNSSEITDSQLHQYELDDGFNSNLLVANFLTTCKFIIQKHKDNSKWTHEDVETRLTKNSAMLIVAAYLAAYTKPSDDKLNFVRYQAKKTSSRQKGTIENPNKPFTLERLVQIYLEVMKKSTGDKVLNFIYNHDCVLADIERLKNLDVLHHQSGFQFCSDSRYKLSTSIKKDYVHRIAMNHGLDLDGFQGIPKGFYSNEN